MSELLATTVTKVPTAYEGQGDAFGRYEDRVGETL